MFCSDMPFAIKLIPTYLCSKHVKNNLLGSSDRERLRKFQYFRENWDLSWGNTILIPIIYAYILNLVDSINQSIFFHKIRCLERSFLNIAFDCGSWILH